MTDANEHPPVTVIGLGLMGSALARAFLDAGHPTTVWNRSSEKAEALTTRGATRAASVADAISASPLVVACVLDDGVLHELLDSAAGAFDGRVLVNLTSGTPEQSRGRAAWAAARGIDYVDGKILAVPSMIGRPEAFLLYSGSSAAFAAHEATLARLGQPMYLGEDAGMASLHDIALLSLMYATITGFLHAAAVMRAEGIDVEAFMPYVTGMLANMPEFLADIDVDVTAGMDGGTEATLDMQVVYLDHIIDVSRRRDVDPTLPIYVEGLIKRAIAAGHGSDSFGRLLPMMAP